ncbi:hypothetical protein CB1_000507003 [Camelus ferus]|nr:hypothetical protein CB1_000507003 [Camelus ferus]
MCFRVCHPLRVSPAACDLTFALVFQQKQSPCLDVPLRKGRSGRSCSCFPAALTQDRSAAASAPSLSHVAAAALGPWLLACSSSSHWCRGGRQCDHVVGEEGRDHVEGPFMAFMAADSSTEALAQPSVK